MCYDLFTYVLYQEKSRQYRAAQRQREETENTKKKQEQRLKVKSVLLLYNPICYFVLCTDTVQFQHH